MRLDRSSVNLKALVFLFAAATALAIISTAQSAAYLTYIGEPVPWAGLLKASLVNWYDYALFVPLLYWLARLWPVDRSGWALALPLHLGLGVICALAKEVLFVAVGELFRPGVFRLPEILAGDYFDEVLFFWAMIGAIQAYLGWKRAQPAAGGQPPEVDRFVVSCSGGYRMIPVDEVQWINAQGNYAELNTAGGRHLIRETMGSLERRLGETFIRVHRSALVNRKHVQRVQPKSHGSYEVVLSGGAQIGSSRSYNNKLRSLIG